jgi:hypothetical protein
MSRFVLVFRKRQMLLPRGRITSVYICATCRVSVISNRVEITTFFLYDVIFAIYESSSTVSWVDGDGRIHELNLYIIGIIRFHKLSIPLMGEITA